MKLRNASRGVLALTALLAVSSSYEGFAQDEMKTVLRSYGNYRFNNVSVFRVREASFQAAISELLKAKNSSKSSAGNEKEVKEKLDPAIRSQVENAVDRADGDRLTTLRELQARNITVDDAVNAYIDFVIANRGAGESRITGVYLITTPVMAPRMTKSNVPQIIALVISRSPKSDNSAKLSGVPDEDIFTIDELRLTEMERAKYGAENMYDYLEIALLQGAAQNITPEARGLGNLTSIYALPTYGNAESIPLPGQEITSRDVQQFIRISEGQPQDYILPNEVIVSYDLISYRRYETSDYRQKFYEYSLERDILVRERDSLRGIGDFVSADELDMELARLALEYITPVNTEVPKYGAELRFGNESVNFPSLWSERVSLNALWNNAKLGIILPTPLWSGLSTSFGQERSLTYAGFGINGAFDFPIKIIRNSGIFHTAFSYVFGDAEEPGYRNRRKQDELGNIIPQNPNDVDHLVRFNAEVHYTFASRIDDSYLFRFGIGGSVFNMETWYNRLDVDANNEERLVYAKKENETIGGISGRIEFMQTSASTPWGASLQYFDEALSAGLWMQVPLTEQVAVRLDARGYAPAFRDKRAWETNSTVFFPNVRVIWNF